MANIDPFVRHMLLVDNVAPDPANPKKLVLRGLIQTVRLTEPVRLPAIIEQFRVLLFLTGGRGYGDAQIIGVEADTGQQVFGSSVHRIDYPADPLEVVTRSIQLCRCVIPRTGLYWIQFWHNGRMLADQPLIVR
jgi:hypothetical protein